MLSINGVIAGLVVGSVNTVSLNSFRKQKNSFGIFLLSRIIIMMFFYTGVIVKETKSEPTDLLETQ
jgi:hypothetical protein